MSMFSLHEQPAKILNHNPSPEQHGDELKLAGVIKLQVVVPAKALDAFDAQMQGFLFRGRLDGDAEVQADIEGKANADISRRMPTLDPLTLNEKFPGFRLVIVKGMGLEEPIILAKCTLSKFEIEPLDGGLVKLTFNAGGTYDAALVSGQLDALMRRDVEITLEPPAVNVAEVSTQGNLPGIEPSGEVTPLLVTALEVDENKSRNEFTVTAIFEDDEAAKVGPWAYRPELAEIAIALFQEIDEPVDFAPDVRESYEAAAAA